MLKFFLWPHETQRHGWLRGLSSIQKNVYCGTPYCLATNGTKDLAAIFYQIYVTIPTSDNTTQLPMQARKPKHNHTMQLMLNVPKTKVADQCTDWNDYILAVNE